MKKHSLIFLVIALVYFVITAIKFEPVIEGDAVSYIRQAKVFNGELGIENDTPRRSPLYPLMMAPIQKIAPNHYLKYVVVIQFVMIAITGFLIFLLVYGITSKPWLSYLASITFFLNLTVINNGFFILTETLTIFLFMCGLYSLYCFLRSSSRTELILSGTLFGLTFLARYNTIGVCFAGVLSLILFGVKQKDFKRTLINLVLFLLPFTIILFSWSLRNQIVHNQFKLIPIVGGVPGANHCSIFIDSTLVVPVEYEEVNRLGIETKEELLGKSKESITEGSLLKYVGRNLLQYQNGYSTKQKVYNKLLKSHSNEEAYKILKGYYTWISSRLTQADLFPLRVFSFLNSFRFSSVTYDAEPQNIVLPSIIILAYKLMYLMVSFGWLITTIIVLILAVIRKSILKNIYSLTLIFFIGYFPLANALTITLHDSNRFTYSAQAIILGSLLINILTLYKMIKEKKLR